MVGKAVEYFREQSKYGVCLLAEHRKKEEELGQWQSQLHVMGYNSVVKAAVTTAHDSGSAGVAVLAGREIGLRQLG